MDNVQNSLINLAVSKPIKQPSGGINQSSEQSSFDKLMKDQQQSLEQSGAAATDSAANKKPMDAVQESEIPSEQEMESRIALAAMAVMQAPVQIQTDPVMQNEQSASLNTSVDVAVETVLTQENVSSVEQIEQPAQPGMNQGEAANVAKNQDTVSLNTPVQQAQQSTEHPVETGVKDNGQEKMAYAQQGVEVEAPLFREVETVPIQVGEAVNAEKAVKEPVSDQLAKGIENALKQGDRKLELELEPKNLGRVKIEMILQQDGSMRVLLHAEKPQTQLLLQRDAGDLQALLGRTTQQEVQVEASQQQQQQQFNYNGQNGHEQQQQEQRRHREENGEDFLHQLRLGLIDEE